MENLAHELYWVGQIEESIELFEHVWTIRSRDLGSRDELTLETQRFLSTALVGGHRFGRAIELDQDLVAYYSQVFGSKDERTMQAAKDLQVAKEWTEWGAKQDPPVNDDPLNPTSP